MKHHLKVFALGGLREIGKNSYGVENEEELILVDFGIKFVTSGELLGLVDGAIPNFAYLVEKRKKIKGVFVTHAHEDHLTGVGNLVQAIPEIPLYGSEFTACLAKQKLNIDPNKKWHIFRDDTVVEFGSFRVRFCRVTHAIPGSYAILVEDIVHKVKVLFSGDFKFDLRYIGEKFDIPKLIDWGREGVDLLLSESTNALVPGVTPSETDVIKQLERIIHSAPGRVIITSFSTNVYRLKKVMEIAKKTKRQIVLLGTSLKKTMKTIRAASLWSLDESIFVKDQMIAKTPANKLIIFCTGSQGEEESVLNKISRNVYPGWKLAPGDHVILTSSAIKDNKTKVEIVNNRLFSSGCSIFENSPTSLLHASGHASQEDLRLFLSLVQPRYFLPNHGETYMLRKHAQIAEEMGVPRENIFVCQNGDVLNYFEKKFFLSSEKIDASPFYILEKKLMPADRLWQAISARNKMLNGGLLSLVLQRGPKGSLELISLFTYGFLNMQKSRSLVEIWKKNLKSFLNQLAPEKLAPAALKEKVKNYVESNLLSELTRNKPLVKVIEV